jgi:DNA ligase 4
MGGLALLSGRFLERRPDRVYGLQERRLQRIIKKTLGMGTSRVYELQRLEDKKVWTLLL